MMPNGDELHKESWHLSKSIPISLIVGLLIQAGVGIWTISSMSSDIESNRELIRAVERSAVSDVAATRDALKDVVRDLSILEVRVHDTDVKIGRIEENLRYISNTLESINATLKNLQ
tara:strand:- start:9907 stop:10257 length:351 start_codon:yes stop_codon:yes gene_type:complete